MVNMRVLLCGLGVLSFVLAASAQTNYSLPANTGAIDVTTLGARGNDTISDEKIIEKAIRDNSDGLRQIYLPAGTYYTSGTIGDMDLLSWPNGYDRFYTLRGAGIGRTVIKLRDRAAGFQDSANAKPVVLCWNRAVLVDRPIPWAGTTEGNSDESNDCHSIHVMHLTIDVGNNNPGAIGLDFTSHNGGGVEDVEIKAGTASGKVGLALNRKWPGPALIENVAITGFDYGIYMRYHNYTMTVENVVLQNQRIVGILHENHSGALRNITSTNSVPAVRNIGLQGMLVMLDCKFNGGSSSAFAVENSEGLFARNIVTQDYQAALKNNGAVVSGIGDTIHEYVTEPWHCALTQSPRRSLGLTIKETPTVPWEPAANWKSIETYQSSVVGGSWAPAVQAAIAAGAVTLYLPNRGRYQDYPISQPVHINGSLRRVVGLSSSFGGNKIVFDNTNSSAVVVLDQVRFDSLEHRSPGTLILNRCIGSNIRTFPGAGDLFVNDACGDNWTIDHTNVWARQLNSESEVMNIWNKGGKLWILGYKTENPKSVLINTDGAQTEILGGVVYPVFAVPDSIPMYVNNQSAFSAVHSYNFWWILDDRKYPYFCKEIRNTVETRFDTTAFPSSTRLKTIVYVSNPDSVGQGSDSHVSSAWQNDPGERARAVRPTAITVRSGRILLDVANIGPYEVVLIGPQGRVVRAMRGVGPSCGEVGVSSRLPGGVYCVNLVSGTERMTRRVLVSR